MFKKTTLIPILALLVLAPLAWFYVVRFESRPPEVDWDREIRYLGRQQSLQLTVADPGSGIRRVRVILSQAGEEKVVLDEEFPALGWMEGGEHKHAEFTLTLEPAKLGTANGAARLTAEAWDHSFNSWFKGNRTSVVSEVTVDTSPPMISVVSNTVYLNQGGSGLVVYRISKDVPEQGLKVNGRFFRGFPVRGQDGLYQALFALPHETSDVDMFLRATDQAGNEGAARFHYRVKRKRFKSDRIELSQGFLDRLAADFVTRYPELGAKGSSLDVFLEINSGMRSENDATFMRLCTQSHEDPLWEGGFESLKNAAARAGFADHRTYTREGQEVAQSVHLGLDLASLARAPIPAGNHGIVVEAAYIGIYGNTVVLDHGAGLFSIYSHLSEFSVQKGDSVKKGQTIGYTGTTGLAGGDHLHLGIAVHGVFVDPIEWLDPKWVEDKITQPMRIASEAGDTAS